MDVEARIEASNGYGERRGPKEGIKEKIFKIKR